MRNFSIAAIAFAIYSSACLAQTGVVKSEGQVIQGATVKATQGDRILMTLTDDSGTFHFDRMTPGSWIVEVDMFGFEHARKEVQIGANPTKVDFTLATAGAHSSRRPDSGRGCRGRRGDAAARVPRRALLRKFLKCRWMDRTNRSW